MSMSKILEKAKTYRDFARSSGSRRYQGVWLKESDEHSDLLYAYCDGKPCSLKPILVSGDTIVDASAVSRAAKAINEVMADYRITLDDAPIEIV